MGQREIVVAARDILSDPGQVVINHHKAGNLERFCAVGAVIRAAGGVQVFRETIDQRWVEQLALVFMNNGREAAVQFIDTTIDTARPYCDKISA
jgi:hypothetical protein